MSFSGGIDLSSLRKQETAPQAAVVKVPSLVMEITEANLPAIVKLSKTVPVVLEFFASVPDANLAKAIESLSGKLILGTVDHEKQPRVAQAFGLRSVPVLFALIKGQPVPIFEGVLDQSQIPSLCEQLLLGAADQQLTGVATLGDLEDIVEELPKSLQEAIALVDEGKLDEAIELLKRQKAENPKDAKASALLAQVRLMQRTQDLDHEGILNSQPDTFETAMVHADVLAAIGDFESCFTLMLALYPQVDSEEQAEVRPRMLEYFEIAGATNDAVKTARARLATLLY